MLAYHPPAVTRLPILLRVQQWPLRRVAHIGHPLPRSAGWIRVAQLTSSAPVLISCVIVTSGRLCAGCVDGSIVVWNIEERLSTVLGFGFGSLLAALSRAIVRKLCHLCALGFAARDACEIRHLRE